MQKCMSKSFPGNTGVQKVSQALEAPNQAPDIIVQNDLSQAVAKHVKLPYPWKSGSEVGSVGKI